MNNDLVALKVKELSALISTHPSLKSYSVLLDSINKRVISKEIFIALFGEFSSGKSSLINAILGMNVLPTDVLPETSKVYEVHFSQKTDSIEVEYRNGEKKFFSGVEWIKELKDDVNIVRIKVCSTSESLPDNIILVDMPGLSSLNEHHQKIIEEYLPKFDAILLTIDASQPVLTKSLEDLLNNLNILEKPCYLVITKVDLKSPADRKEIIEFIKGIKEIKVNGFALTSAKENYLKELHGIFEQISKEKDDILLQSNLKSLIQICKGIINEINGQIQLVQASESSFNDELKKVEEDLKKIQIDLGAKLNAYSKKLDESTNMSLRIFKEQMESFKSRLITTLTSTSDPELGEKKFVDEFSRCVRIASRKAILHSTEVLKAINKEFLTDLADMFEPTVSYSAPKKVLSNVGSEVITVGALGGALYMGLGFLSGVLGGLPLIGGALSQLIIPSFSTAIFGGLVGRVFVGSSLKKWLSGLTGKLSDLTTRPLIEKQIDENINRVTNEFEKLLFMNKEEAFLKIKESLNETFEKMQAEKEKVKEEILKMRAQEETKRQKTIEELVATREHVQKVLDSIQ